MRNWIPVPLQHQCPIILLKHPDLVLGNDLSPTPSSCDLGQANSNHRHVTRAWPIGATVMDSELNM